MTRKISAIVAVAFAAILFAVSPSARAQTGDGWTQLFDGKSLGDWDQVGETN